MRDAALHESSVDIVVNLTTCDYFIIRNHFPITPTSRLTQRGIKPDPKQKNAASIGGESSGPYGVRTRVSALRGLHPSPLDEWANRKTTFRIILGCRLFVNYRRKGK